MKKSILILAVSILGFNQLFSQVAINTNGAVPNSKSMLDITSATKGVLIPRMTSTQRGQIASPVNALLVFDTTTKSFWFYDINSTSWKEIKASNNNNVIADADGDTKVDVEKYADSDLISFYQSGTEYFTMKNGRLQVDNTGSSVFLGYGAGDADDLSDNNNTFIGTSAGLHNINGDYNIAMGSMSFVTNLTGSNNIALGDHSLYSSQTADDNVALGANSLYANTANYNTATGSNALNKNTSGEGNGANGYLALYRNTTGEGNIAVGKAALHENTTVDYLVAIGDSALQSNTSGTNNVAIGSKSLHSNTSGNNNSALGFNSLKDVTSGYHNTAIGANSMLKTTTSYYNTAVGSLSLYENTTGIANTAIGYQAMEKNVNGEKNVSIGYKSSNKNTSGAENIAIGYRVFESNLSGSDNTAIGSSAMFSNTTGDRNIAIGKDALAHGNTSTDNVAVGFEAVASSGAGKGNVGVGNYSLRNVGNGVGNVALGKAALFNTNSKNYNVGIGDSAILYNSGNNNTGVGSKVLRSNTGSNNTALGYQAGYSSNTGSSNIFLGYQAGYNETGSNKLFIDNSNTATPLIYGDFTNDTVKIYGTLKVKDEYSLPLSDGSSGQVIYTNGVGDLYWAADAGAINIDGLSDGKTAGSGNDVFLGSGSGTLDNDAASFNTGLGYASLNRNVSGIYNVAVGNRALYLSTNSNKNTAIGYKAMYNSSGSEYNVAIGHESLLRNTTGNGNVAIGTNALTMNQTGSTNTVVGYQAGEGTSLHNKSGSVMIGYRAGMNEQTSNKLYIENSDATSPLIYGEFDNDLVTVNGRFGVGTNADINTKMRVSHDGLYSGYFTSSNHNNATKIVRAEYTGTANHDVAAIYGDVTPNSNTNYGYGGHFFGNYMAVLAQADAGSSTGASYGVYAISEGTAGSRYGVYGYASGSSDNRYGVYGSAAAVTNSYAIYCDGNGVYTGTWSQSSDRKLKKNIEPMQNALAKLLQLQPSTYNYRIDEFSFMNLSEAKQIGFVAQDVEEIFPELVSTVSHPKSHGKETDIEKYKAINYIGLIPVLTQAVKEQQQMIVELVDENKSLLSKLELFEQRLNQLENK